MNAQLWVEANSTCTLITMPFFEQLVFMQLVGLVALLFWSQQCTSDDYRRGSFGDTFLLQNSRR